MSAGRTPKFDAETVRIVRRWHAAWSRIPKPVEVARALGVSKSTLDHLVQRRTYKWVKQ